MVKKFSRFSFAAKFSLFLFALSAVGCKHEKPNVIYMPDMVYSPAVKAQQVGSMRMPVPGTVERNFVSYPFAKNPDGAARVKNPLKLTQQVAKRGQFVFNTYCIVCHGSAGEGDGSIIPKFPRPPSLQSDKVRNWSDGMLYHTVTMGQNLMPSYASQIGPGDRWALIHYVRILQRSKHPTPEDIKISDQESN